MLTRWFEIDPTYSAMEELRRRMDQLFFDMDPVSESSRGWSSWPHANLYDTGENLMLKAEVPGLDEKDLQIEAVQDVLTVSGERKVEVPEGHSVHRQERASIRFSRSFSFPVKVDVDKITAEVKSGVLTVTLPKSPEVKPRAISVQVR